MKLQWGHQGGCSFNLPRSFWEEIRAQRGDDHLCTQERGLGSLSLDFQPPGLWEKGHRFKLPHLCYLVTGQPGHHPLRFTFQRHEDARGGDAGLRKQNRHVSAMETHRKGTHARVGRWANTVPKQLQTEWRLLLVQGINKAALGGQLLGTSEDHQGQRSQHTRAVRTPEGQWVMVPR